MKNWKGTKSPIHEDGVYCDTLNGVSNELLNESDQVVVDVYGSNVDEMNANTALVLDSFHVVQKCDLLPSELLKQRDELLGQLKSVRESRILLEYPEDTKPEHYNEAIAVSRMFVDIDQLIKKIEP